MSTLFHAKFWAHSLRLAHPRNGIDALSRSIGNARVDLNPHQVDAALFALRSPYTKGVLLADEVGLGKTIEALLLIMQKWAERRRRILLIVPATLRKQWQTELRDKFFLPSIILETKSANLLLKDGSENPFTVQDQIVISSYQFVFAKRDLVRMVQWDLVVVDEAHRLRNIYKGVKTAQGIVEAIAGARRKILLTATPLQNSLLELYGLVSILDPNLFGSIEAFADQFLQGDDIETRDVALRQRLQSVCKRTLRRQVLEYIPFTDRFTHTADFVPSPAEEQLYEQVSSYLQRETLIALPNARRKLITLILRKLLASSSAAIGSTLSKFADRLAGQVDAPVEVSLAEDFETLGDVEEEWPEEPQPDAHEGEMEQRTRDELADLQRFVKLAQSVDRDSKASKLIESLPVAFALAREKDADTKAVIFTESRKTQEYLFKLLSDSGYAGQIVLMNGTNSDETSKRIYAGWKKRNEHRWADVSSGSKSADMKAAIVDEFRDHATLLLATESAAEGVNLQFCSIVINYDLPWNPQRIEQRIGRCHRYGQKSDVLVVNFLNRKNEADRRVFELLDQKFNLFKGVFGASDEVLGAVESGVDLEKRIAAIYQDCRTSQEIKVAFDALQRELDETIQANMDRTRRAVLDNFDAEVHERLRLHREKAKQSLDAQQQMLLDLARFELAGRANFEPDEARFELQAQTDRPAQRFHLDWQKAAILGDTFFRLDEPLAVELIELATKTPTPLAEVTFRYDPHASALETYCGRTGWLEVTRLSAQSVGEEEEVLLLSACDDTGEVLVPEVAGKLFSLKGEVSGQAGLAIPAAVAEIRERLHSGYLEGLALRNQAYFEEEVEKLDRWAEDLKEALERELKNLDVEMRAARKASKAGVTLAEKLEAQKVIKNLELKRTQKRRELFNAQDEVDRRREDLIEEAQRQLDTQSTCEVLFCLRWRLGEAQPERSEEPHV